MMCSDGSSCYGVCHCRSIRIQHNWLRPLHLLCVRAKKWNKAAGCADTRRNKKHTNWRNIWPQVTKRANNPGIYHRHHHHKMQYSWVETRDEEYNAEKRGEQAGRQKWKILKLEKSRAKHGIKRTTACTHINPPTTTRWEKEEKKMKMR